MQNYMFSHKIDIIMIIKMYIINTSLANAVILQCLLSNR